MTVHTSQRLIAISFVIGMSAILILFARLFSWASISLSLSIVVVLGSLGWIIMLFSCVIVIAHPKPEETFLGRFALLKEPLLRGDVVDTKRKILTFSVV